MSVRIREIMYANILKNVGNSSKNSQTSLTNVQSSRQNIPKVYFAFTLIWNDSSRPRGIDFCQPLSEIKSMSFFIIIAISEIWLDYTPPIFSFARSNRWVSPNIWEPIQLITSDKSSRSMSCTPNSCFLRARDSRRI